jgi:hypothetical protein
MPAVCTGNAGRVGVDFMMTTSAAECRDSLSLRTPDDVCKMPTAIVAMLWIVRRRVTVDATRRGQD